MGCIPPYQSTLGRSAVEEPSDKGKPGTVQQARAQEGDADAKRHREPGSDHCPRGHVRHSRRDVGRLLEIEVWPR